jgi:hypothetical protein
VTTGPETANGHGESAAVDGDAAVGPVEFFVPDLVRLDVGPDGRVIVAGDLDLDPVASVASTRAADELGQMLGGFHEPGLFVIAGDGFEMLAAAPDVDAILDSHPQFTDATKRFADEPGHTVVVLPGNHDGQLAWDADSVSVLRARLGVSRVSLACDVAFETRPSPSPSRRPAQPSRPEMRWSISRRHGSRPPPLTCPS